MRRGGQEESTEETDMVSTIWDLGVGTTGHQGGIGTYVKGQCNHEERIWQDLVLRCHGNEAKWNRLLAEASGIHIIALVHRMRVINAISSQDRENGRMLRVMEWA